jgi:lysyl-tRNA synthetase class 2
MSAEDWRPAAARHSLERRAHMLARARYFFAQRQVLEVDTPVVVGAPVSDVHVHSAEVRFPGVETPFFLHTSPEYAMKRLLAAGSGDIYQICHVVRGMERGRLHNAEFTLIEWYRLGYTIETLMKEVRELVMELLRDPESATGGARLATEYLSYREAFLQELGLDPFEADLGALRRAAQDAGFQDASRCEDRDELLDVLMATSVGPRLGHGSLCFVHRYPRSQAALAQIDPADSRCALRFELYCEGVELANGFRELTSEPEQRERFERDVQLRRARGLPVQPIDERLLAALAAGLPDCAGIALGFDRLVMLAAQAQDIDAVLPFPIERA